MYYHVTRNPESVLCDGIRPRRDHTSDIVWEEYPVDDRCVYLTNSLWKADEYLDFLGYEKDVHATLIAVHSDALDPAKLMLDHEDFVELIGRWSEERASHFSEASTRELMQLREAIGISEWLAYDASWNEYYRLAIGAWRNLSAATRAEVVEYAMLDDSRLMYDGAIPAHACSIPDEQIAA